MGKAEVIAELAHLSAEELADVNAWIDRITAVRRSVSPTLHLRSPRLADLSKPGDFTKEVITAFAGS